MLANDCIKSIEIFYGRVGGSYLAVVPRLGERLRQLVEASGRQHKSIALKAGVNVTTFSKILSGEDRNPGFELVARIARELNVSLDEILSDGFRPPVPEGPPLTRRYRRLIEALELLDDTSRVRIARFAEWTARTIAAAGQRDTESGPRERNQRRG